MERVFWSVHLAHTSPLEDASNAVLNVLDVNAWQTYAPNVDPVYSYSIPDALKSVLEQLSMESAWKNVHLASLYSM